MAHAGFDRAEMPPLEMMARLKRETNLEWCGYYLKSPSQSGKGWKGQRANLVSQGWGLAPIYVGQQVTGPGAKIVTAVQGAQDGRDACAQMASEGFPAKSWVYLDLENGPPFTASQKAYVGAWVDAVRAGGFCPGVYCSYLFAAEVTALRQGVRIWVFHVPTVKPHPIAGKIFLTPEPKTSGYPQAVIWQRDNEARLSAFGDLSCDLNSSVMRDPGAPAMTFDNVTPISPPDVPKPVQPVPEPSLLQWFLSLFKRAA